jgi:uncharacterized protein YgiM (DUF1202 family)
MKAVAEQVGLLGGLSPVAVVFVTNDDTTIYQGPAASYGVVGTVDAGELAAVLGQNSGGNWFYVITISALQGWLPADALHVTGTPEKAPVVPPNPLEAAIAQAISATSTGHSSGSAAGQQTLTIADLKPAAKAKVNHPSLNVRQRPGATYKLLDTLSQNDEVTVLALNRDKQWALVETAAQKWGWVSLEFLEVEGSLSDAPQVQTLPPGKEHPPDQAAPIVALSSTGPAITADSSGDGTATTAAMSSSPALPGNTLAPVATARVNRKEDIRRGPDNSYGAVDTLTVDEKVSVLAVSPQKDWAVVQAPPNSRVGWFPVDDLEITEGSLANAAQVLTAWVDSNDLAVRRGPGIYYESVGTLAINNLVSVLGLNEGKNWALVETITGGQGWIPLRFLTISGALADIPLADSPPLATEDAGVNQANLQAQSPPGGQIVLQLVSGGDIMMINADGSDLRRLTAGIDPALSPDGQTVAFTRWEGKSGSLWLIDTDGSNERSVLGFTKQAKGPAWAPDGSQIVVNFQHGGRLEEKSHCEDMAKSPRPPMNAGNIRVGLNSDFEPELCWTLPPDPFWGLRVINLADGQFKDVDGGTYAFRPAWDPKQPWRIISDGGQGLLEVDLNRDYRQTITGKTGDSSPAFSPDGRFLAVTTGHPGGGQGYDIYRLNADGSGRVRLTQTPLWETVQPEEKKPWNNVAPTWSPDGSQIAFLTDRTGRWEIWIMKIDGTHQRPMFSEEINSQLEITYNFVDEHVLSWK